MAIMTADGPDSKLKVLVLGQSYLLAGSIYPHGSAKRASNAARPRVVRL